MPFGDHPYGELESHDLVCALQGGNGKKIQFMLGGSHFVEGGFYPDPQLFQGKHHVSSGVFTKIQRTEIQIACLVVSGHGCHPVFICVKEKEFALRRCLRFDSHCFCLFQYILQDGSGTSLVSFPILVVNITDQACHFSLLGTPWQDGEGIRIRMEIHIGFFNSGKPFEGRTVEGTFVLQCFFQLSGSDRHVFHRTAHVGKLEADEFHILFLRHGEDLFFRVF